MLKFKKESANTSPVCSPVASPKTPRLKTRIDSMRSIEKPSIKCNEKIHENRTSDESNTSDSDSVSPVKGFLPTQKMLNATKRKLDHEKKKLLKASFKRNKNLLSIEDFYSKQQELRIWLHEEVGTNMDDLSDKQIKECYKRFMDKWNKKKLPMKFYRGLDVYSASLTSDLPLARSSSCCKKDSSEQSDSLWLSAPTSTSIQEFSSPVKVEEKCPSPPRTPCSTFGQKFAMISKLSPKARPTSKLMLSDVILPSAQRCGELSTRSDNNKQETSNTIILNMPAAQGSKEVMYFKSTRVDSNPSISEQTHNDENTPSLTGKRSHTDLSIDITSEKKTPKQAKNSCESTVWIDQVETSSPVDV